MKTIYLVLPCYNEEEVLHETASRLKVKMEQLKSENKITEDSRITFVDDGSKDRTWSIIEELNQSDDIFAGVKLSRNKGHQNALLAGLMTVKDHCDAAISLDADLQDDINAIDKMRSLNDFEVDKQQINLVRELVIYFPDDGAYKRYKDAPCFKNFNCIYGKKERDWETGKILGIEIYDKNGSKLTNELENCDVLMVDDIISYGGTLAYSADKLKEMGATHISAYATHVENSVLDEEKGTLLKRYKDKIIDTVYTTNSIYHGNHPMVEVIYKF